MFTRRDHLKRHDINRHTGGQSKCEYCSKVFESEDRLCKHLLLCSHADETSDSLKIDPLSKKMKSLSNDLLGKLVK